MHLHTPINSFNAIPSNYHFENRIPILPKPFLPGLHIGQCLLLARKSGTLQNATLTNNSTTGSRINALLESPVLWAGRVCIFYSLLKSGLAGSPSNPIYSPELEAAGGDLDSLSGWRSSTCCLPHGPASTFFLVSTISQHLWTFMTSLWRVCWRYEKKSSVHIINGRLKPTHQYLISSSDDTSSRITRLLLIIFMDIVRILYNFTIIVKTTPGKDPPTTASTPVMSEAFTVTLLLQVPPPITDTKLLPSYCVSYA